MPETLTLNKSAILESMGGDAELFAEMAQMFIDESPQYSRNLLASLSASSPQALRDEAHTLKSLFATFADEDGRQLALLVEQKAKVGEIDAERGQELARRIGLLAETLRQTIG